MNNFFFEFFKFFVTLPDSEMFDFWNLIQGEEIIK